MVENVVKHRKPKPYSLTVTQLFTILPILLTVEEPYCSFDPAIYNSIYNASRLPRCPSEVGRYSTPILMGIYVLFANILLLNLLIAMFRYGSCFSMLGSFLQTLCYIF